MRTKTRAAAGGATALLVLAAAVWLAWPGGSKAPHGGTSPKPTAQTTLLVRPPGASVASPTVGCFAKPSACGWPDASTTGASGILRVVGPIAKTTEGEVIENLAVTGHITVTSAEVTIRNVSIVGDAGLAAIDAHAAPGPVTIDHVTVTYPDGVFPVSAGAIWGRSGLTVRSSNISGSPDGIDASGDPVLIEDNWVHDLRYNIRTKSHDDAIQTLAGNIVIRHNTLDATSPGSNSCLQIGNLLGNLEQLTFENNLCDGGGYSINANPANLLEGKVTAGPLNFVGNRFGRDFKYGLRAHLSAPFTVNWSNNVSDADGRPVPGVRE